MALTQKSALMMRVSKHSRKRRFMSQAELRHQRKVERRNKRIGRNHNRGV